MTSNVCSLTFPLWKLNSLFSHECSTEQVFEVYTIKRRELNMEIIVLLKSNL